MTCLVLVEEHVELSDTDSKIGFIELVGDVPAEGTKFPPLLNQGVEEAEAVQHLLQSLLLEKMEQNVNQRPTVVHGFLCLNFDIKQRLAIHKINTIYTWDSSAHQ